MRLLPFVFALAAASAAQESEGWLELGGRAQRETDDEVRVWLDYHEANGSGAYANIWEVRSAALAADGRFAFAGLPPGRYTLHLEGKKHGYWRREWILLAASRTDLAIELSLAGVVEGTIARPYPDAGLRPPVVSVYGPGGSWYRNATADAEGRFVLRGMQPGRYEFLFMHARAEDDHVSTWREVTVREGRQELKAALALDAPVRLTAGLPDGVADAEAVLEIDRPGGPDWFRFKAERTRDGRVVLTELFDHDGGLAVPQEKRPHLALAGFKPGAYAIELSGAGLRRRRKTVRVGAEGRIHFDLEARRGQFIRTDVPSHFFAVELQRADDPQGTWERMLWMDWRAQISHMKPPGEVVAFLPPGRYVARLRSRDSVEARLEPFEIGADRSERILRFRSRPGATASGRVLSPRGRPVDSGEMHVFRRDGGAWTEMPYKFAGIDEGRYEIRGLGPGRYRVAYTEARTPVLGEFDVDRRDVAVDLRFPAER